MALIAFPLAHFASLPIRRLREATAKSIEPPGNSASRSSIGSFESMADGHVDGGEDLEEANGIVLARKEGLKNPVSNWRQKRHQDRELRRDRRRKREFRIPGKIFHDYNTCCFSPCDSHLPAMLKFSCGSLYEQQEDCLSEDQLQSFSLAEPIKFAMTLANIVLNWV